MASAVSGGTPRLFIANVASPISWSPDGQRLAFLRTQVTPALSSQLIVADGDGGQERALGKDDASAPWISLVAPWRPSFAPAWSPDGRLIAVAAAGRDDGRVVFVDSQTGSSEAVRVRNGSGSTSGLSWIDAESLALNQDSQFGGQFQLFRLRYPAGPVSRLTSDPNDYVGISRSGDRRDLVTAPRNARMDLWVGDGGGTTGDQRRRACARADRMVRGSSAVWGGGGGRPNHSCG